MQKVTTFIFHILYIALAIFSLQYLQFIPSRYIGILEILPFVLVGLSLILGYRFNRSLVIFSALLFIIIYSYFFFAPPLNQQQQFLSLNSLGIFVSFNIALICFYSERGILTPIGISRFILIFIQIGLFFWLIYYQHGEWQKVLKMTLYPPLEIKLAFFGQVSLLAILCCIIIISSSYLTQANPFRSAIFASMLLVLYAITLPTNAITSISVLISFALLLPLFSLISESYRMAFMDELTNLPGRRALNETMNKLGNQYVIAMLDVDHFKKFNDTYGHDAGDDVLQLLGAKLKGVTGGGKPFRYGGEEFAIVFFGADLDDVEEHLEDLRESVAGKKFALRKQERRKKGKKSAKGGKQRYVSVTISIGYAERTSQQSNPNAVLKAADKALYRAKKKGRNCICT